MAAPQPKRLRVSKVEVEPVMAPEVPAVFDEEQAEEMAEDLQGREPTRHELEVCAAEMHAECVDCIAIEENPPADEYGLQAKWLKAQEETTISLAESVTGRYWKLADFFNGHSVWRQEVQGTVGGYFIFVSEHMDGWIMAASIEHCDDSVKSPKEVSGWAPIVEGNQWPQAWHFPYPQHQICILLRTIQRYHFLQHHILLRTIQRYDCLQTNFNHDSHKQ